MEICNFIPIYASKQRALTVIKIFLQSQHRKVLNRYVLKIHNTYDYGSVAAWAKSVIRRAGRHQHHWKAHVLHRLTIMQLPAQSWNLKLINIQKSSKMHKWRDTSTAGNCETCGTLDLDKLISDRPEAPDMIRYPANSKTQMTDDSFKSEVIQDDFCKSWLSDTGLNHNLINVCPKQLTTPEAPYIPPTSMLTNVTRNPEDLVGDLYKASIDRNATCIVEDKGPSIVWKVSEQVFDIWENMMKGASDGWTILDSSTAQILNTYRNILNYIVPRNLSRESNCFSGKHIPYAYFTVKYNCFQNGTQVRRGQTIHTNKNIAEPNTKPPHPADTCRKEGHSCLRNIVSFRHMPGRSTFKKIGRAFVHCIREVSPGYGLRDLSRVKDVILEGLGKQFPRICSSGRCCVQCWAAMSAPTLHTADAGQADEMVQQKHIDKAVDFVFNGLRRRTKRRDPIISVMHTTKTKPKNGGWITDRLRDRSVFFLSKIQHCMQQLLKCRCYVFGDNFLYQTSGIPIGGP